MASIERIEYVEDAESTEAREARHLAARRFEEFTTRTVVQYLRDEVHWGKEFHELVFSGHMYGALVSPRIRLSRYTIVKQDKRSYTSLVQSPLGEEFLVTPHTWAALGEQVRDLFNRESPLCVADKLRISGGLIRIKKGILTKTAYAQPYLELERLA